MIREYLIKKKPLTLKAIEFTEELTNEELQKWSNKNAFITHLDREDEPCVVVNKSFFKAYYGDWIVCDEGIYYVVKKDVVHNHYDFLRD